MTILTFDHPTLRLPCDCITAEEFFIQPSMLIQWLDDMNTALTTASNPKGIALAAPQIGITKRIIAVNNEILDTRLSSGIYFLINPVLYDKSKFTTRDTEGCLSLPGVVSTVDRPLWIEIRYQKLDGHFYKKVFRNFAARVICHEIDHLDGILMTDIAVTGSKQNIS